MACKRSAVRSRVAPPSNRKPVIMTGFLFFSGSADNILLPVELGLFPLGQGDMDDEASLWRIAGGYGAAMGFYGAFGDGKTQPMASGISYMVKGLENLFQHLLRNPRTCILNRDEIVGCGGCKA